MPTEAIQYLVHGRGLSLRAVPKDADLNHRRSMRFRCGWRTSLPTAADRPSTLLNAEVRAVQDRTEGGR